MLMFYVDHLLLLVIFYFCDLMYAFLGNHNANIIHMHCRATIMLIVFDSAARYCEKNLIRCSELQTNARVDLSITRRSFSLSGKPMLLKAGSVSIVNMLHYHSILFKLILIMNILCDIYKMHFPRGVRLVECEFQSVALAETQL